MTHWAHSKWSGFYCVIAATALVFLCFGFNGWLYRDDAIYTYIGQQLANGGLPYASVFDHKTPLSGILAGVFVTIGRLIGIEDLHSVRIGYFLISIFSCGALYLLAYQLFRSRFRAMLSGLIMSGFWTFGREAASGPRAKTPFVLFEVLFILAAIKKNWLLAGVFGALCTWVWQPGVFFAISAGILPLLIEKDLKSRISGTLRGTLGVVLTTGVFFAWFYANDIFSELIEGSVKFKLSYLYREPMPLMDHFLAPLLTFYKGYQSLYLLGLSGIVWLILKTYKAFRVFSFNSNTRDELLMLQVFGMTLFPPVFWTLLDFQGAADLYPFLPYIAIGSASLIAVIVEEARAFSKVDVPKLKKAVFVFFTLAFCVQYFAAKETGLLDQKASVELAVQQFGNDPSKYASIGSPESLVILGFSNPNRYVYIIDGIDQKIESEFPGGIKGWLQSLDLAGVEVIFFGPTHGPHRKEIMGWLNRYYEKRRYGYIDAYVRNKREIQSF